MSLPSFFLQRWEGCCSFCRLLCCWWWGWCPRILPVFYSSCCAMVCEFLLQTTPCFLRQRQGGCLDSLQWSTCLCKYTALHDPDSAFCQFSPQVDITVPGSHTDGCSAAGIELFNCLSLEHNSDRGHQMAAPPLASSFHSVW